MDTNIDISLKKAIKYYRLVKIMANNFSKDPSTKVGALFLKPKTLEILTLGYNGMPRGIDETKEERWERPTKYKYTEHAERNAVYNAARNGVSLIGSICIVTLFPCCDCARAIIQSGASTVISPDYNENSNHDRWRDSWNASQEMFDESGVNVILLSEKDIKLDNNEAKELLDGLFVF